MQMKDKLVKTHHKGLYYKTRKVGLIFSISSVAVALIALPTYFALETSKNASKVKASDETSEVTPETEEKASQLLVY